MRIALVALIAALAFSQSSTAKRSNPSIRTSQPYTKTNQAPKPLVNSDQKVQYQELGQLFKKIGKQTKEARKN